MHITKVREESSGKRKWGTGRRIDEGKPPRTVKGDPRRAAVHRT